MDIVLLIACLGSLHTKIFLISLEDNNNHMAWLSNTSTVLLLLQQSLKATGFAPRMPLLFFVWKDDLGICSSSANLSVGPLDVVLQVKAKYLALHFKKQLKIYV